MYDKVGKKLIEAIGKSGLGKTADSLKVLQLLDDVIEPRAIERRLRKANNPLLQLLITEQIEAAYRQISSDWSSVRSTFDSTIDQAVDTSARQIKTAGQFKDRLVQRIRSNPQATVEELIKLITTEFKFYSEAGAVRIARTTATAATGLAQTAAFEPFEGVARWLTTRDTRRRKDHAAADGQERSEEGYYLIGGHQMEYPGDPSAPAKQVIHCRCSQFFQKA